ncbi:MAG: response regulator [Nitrosomonadales bacterium]|nr:response regulator [Nitrosomonadales bacterium]
MRINFLRLDEDRVLAEQLSILMRNVRGTFVFDSFLALILLWILSNDGNALGMMVWSSTRILSHFTGFVLARRHEAGVKPDRARRLAWTWIFLFALDGVSWGALAWAALDASMELNSLLVLAVLAASLGANVSQLSPVIPVFLSFALTMLATMVSKVWLLDNRTYDVLGALAFLYVAILFVQALNSARSARDTIELRFDNSELLSQLREKTVIAETAQREAEHANAAKSKFLAAASHDLRQPIHAQGLFLEALARSNLTDSQRGLLTSARAASTASSELLSALLDFSRIEAGVIEPQHQPFHIQPLLNKIENDLAPQADKKHIVYRTRETDLAVHSDPVLLELVLRNLISNAIRYTNCGGVLVTCRKRGTQAWLEVWDTGIGISPEHQKEVFREFYQLGNPERDRNKGLGLGLAIAEGLTRTLGHRLSLSSIPQRGSMFRLTLSLSTAALPSEQASMVQSKTRVLTMRILVIDDDENVREGMLHLLRDWGCECDAAESIEEGLALAQLNAPDVVISDYRLREQRTGVEAIAALRALLGDSLPALLITGDTAPERLREAQASGVPLLHKPVSPSKLYRRLVEVMQQVTA